MTNLAAKWEKLIAKETKNRARKLQKSIRKLDRKQELILALLGKRGVKLPENQDYNSVLGCARAYLGLGGKTDYPTPHGYHNAYTQIIRYLGHKKPRTHEISDIDLKIKRFYLSVEWRKARWLTLKTYGFKCQACGRTPVDAVLHVDHIRPIRKFWDLRLSLDNMQVLCDECNHGKGSWDYTDVRPYVKRVRVFLLESIPHLKNKQVSDEKAEETS